MKLLQLRYFCVLAHVLNYRKSAEQLYISQPALSHMISELEKELGILLFYREKKKIRLTVYGQSFLKTTEHCLCILDNGVKALERIKNTTSGIVRIGYIESIRNVVIPKIKEACHDEPELKLRFMQNVHGGLMNALLADQSDFVLSAGTHPKIESIPLFEQKLIAIVSEHNPLAQRTSISFEELVHEPFILLDTESALWKQLKERFNELGVEPNIVEETRQCSTAMKYVAHNEGITILPISSIDRTLPIKMLNITSSGFVRHIFLSWKKGKAFSPSASNVKEHILRIFAVQNH